MKAPESKTATKDYTYAIKVQFEEKNRSILGFFILLVTTSEMMVFKSSAIVNYYSQKFLKQHKLTTDWVNFMQRIEDELKLVGELILIEHGEHIKQYYESCPAERLTLMTERLIDFDDMNLKKLLMDEMFGSDLTTIFPNGDFTVDYLTEFIEVKDKPKPKKEKKKKKVKADDEENEAEEVAGEVTEDQEQKKKKKKKKHKNQVDRSEGKEDQDDEAGEDDEEKQPLSPNIILAVEPVFDPVAGISARSLRNHDIVYVVKDTRTKEKIRGRILSTFKHDKKHRGFNIEMIGGRKGQMIVSNNTMVKAETFNVSSETPFYQSPVFYVIIFLAVIVIAILLVAFGGFVVS